MSFLFPDECHFSRSATLSVRGEVELKEQAHSDLGRSFVTELEKMGWFENCWAKLSPFWKVLLLIKDKADTAFQNCSLNLDYCIYTVVSQFKPTAQ